MAVLMNRVEERTDLDTTLKIINFTLDSESVKTLMDYANMVHAGKKQQFLSGSLVQLSVISGQLSDNLSQSATTDHYLLTTSHFLLIDKEGCVRGIYDGLYVKDVDGLISDISELETAYYIKEQHEKKHAGKEDDDGAM